MVACRPVLRGKFIVSSAGLAATQIPRVQTEATVPSLGDVFVFVHDSPVIKPGCNKELAKVVCLGVCQSDGLTVTEYADYRLIY